MNLKFKLFGIYKSDLKTAQIELEFPCPLTVAMLRKSLAKEFHPRFADAAVASEEELLDSQFVLHESTTLNLLPPVCGG